MKTFATIAALASLASISSAATVTLTETKCGSPSESLGSFTIEAGKLVTKELDSVCGLKITSADGVDPQSLVCQAFKDREGKTPGSSQFTYRVPALISTNPVQEAAIKCDIQGASSSGAVVTSIATGTPGAITATVSASVTVIASSFASVSSATGGLPVPNGGHNQSTPGATGTPTASGGAAEFTGAAAKVGLSAAGLVGAFAVALL